VDRSKILEALSDYARADLKERIGEEDESETLLEMTRADLSVYDRFTFCPSTIFAKAAGLTVHFPPASSGQYAGSDFHIYLRLQQQESFLTVTFDTEHDVHYTRLDARRAASESRSTRIVEVENAGERGERSLPAGRDHGFLWALNSYWRFSETPSGVYVQCEAISLTRDIPAGLGPLIGGYIETIAKDSLGTTLRHTRDAVLKRKSAVRKQTNSVSGSR